jgi:hypothetical protein
VQCDAINTSCSPNRPFAAGTPFAGHSFNTRERNEDPTPHRHPGQLEGVHAARVEAGIASNMRKRRHCVLNGYQGDHQYARRHEYSNGLRGLYLICPAPQ